MPQRPESSWAINVNQFAGVDVCRATRMNGDSRFLPTQEHMRQIFGWLGSHILNQQYSPYPMLFQKYCGRKILGEGFPAVIENFRARSMHAAHPQGIE